MSAPDPSFLRDSFASTAFAEALDRSLNAAVARYSTGLSPMAQVAAYCDWASHLAFAPGKRMQLAEKAVKKSARFANYLTRRTLRMDGAEPCIEPLPQDRRFVNEAWRKPPFDAIYQSFLLTQQWWHNATTGVHGVTASTRRWSRSARGNSWTCSRRRISSRPIRRSSTGRCGKAA